MSVINVQDAVPDSGFLRDWLTYCAPFEPPDSYCLFAMLSAASCAINRRIIVNPDGEPEVFTNMYVLLIGPSGSRKGAAMKHAIRLLGDAEKQALVLPRTFTVSGMIDYFSDKTTKGRIEYKKGISTEPIICSGLMVSDEFSRVIGGAEYHLENLGFLTEMWDCPNTHTRRTRSHQMEEFINVYLSIMAASAPDWLEKTDPKVLTGGALRRILGVVEYGPKLRNHRPIRDAALFDRLAVQMKERVGFDAFNHEFMELDDEAWEAKAAWYHGPVAKLQAAGDERQGHFASCMEAHALKVAALVQLLEGGPPDLLAARHLRTAQRLVEAITPNLFQAYASLVPTAFARLRAAIVRALQSNDGAMDDATLDKHIHTSTGATPRDRIIAKSSLIDDGILVKRGKGPKARISLGGS